jgi:tetratricopeptide (TPR) repeat protein
MPTHRFPHWIPLLVLCLLSGTGCNDGPEAPKDASEVDPTRQSQKQPLPKPQPLPPELKQVYRTLLGTRYEAGRSAAQAYLKSHPESAPAHLMIGLSYFKADNHGAARPYFEKSLSLAPGDYIAHDFLAQALFLLGDLQGSRTHYESLRLFIPADPKPLVRLGIIDQEQDMTDEAREHFRLALECFEQLRKRDPRSYAGQQQELGNLYARRAELAFAQGDYATARLDLEQATTAWPKNISAFFTLSLVYRRLGEEALAQATLQKYETAKQSIIKGQAQSK